MAGLRLPLVGVAFLASTFGSLAASPEIYEPWPYCSTGTCVYQKILDVRSQGKSSNGALARVIMAYSEEVESDVDVRNVRWLRQTTRYVFCSILNPAVIDFDMGFWSALLLAPGYPNKFSRSVTTDYELYLRVCHGLITTDPSNSSIAIRYGYPRSLVDKPNSIKLRDPEEIMNNTSEPPGRTGSVSAPSSRTAQVCGWYAMGGCFSTLRNAQQRADDVGGHVVNNDEVPNFTPGFFCVVRGPFDDRSEAMHAQDQFYRAGVYDSYVKPSC